MSRALLSYFVSLSVFASFAFAESATPAPAVVTFTIDFPASQPEHYSIRIPSDGSARYQSSGRVAAVSSADAGDDSDNNNNDVDSFNLDFVVTPETRQKVFDWAAKAGYFQRDFDSHHKGLAFTGTKTLAYGDAMRSGVCTYNYSENAAVQALTGLMQNLSVTLEFGHRLQYDYRYQKLALEDELKRMEDLARSNQLVEVGALQSILGQIVADPSVINVTRARAQRLLSKAGLR